MHPKPTKETTSVKVILEWAKEKLLGAQIESPILDARLLLGFALGTPHERFYGSEDKILTKSLSYVVEDAGISNARGQQKKYAGTIKMKS